MGPGRGESAWRWTARHAWRCVRAVLIAALKYVITGSKYIGFGYFPIHSSFLCPEPAPPADEPCPHTGEAEAPLLPAELRAWRELEKVLRRG